ncbi:MAG: flagellar hook-basal body complex protein FliE [Gammaproteobacteria bacterium]|nr:flagellar hook-basal body complex protein FliE [Gammaproteobacteria bacterium]
MAVEPIIPISEAVSTAIRGGATPTTNSSFGDWLAIQVKELDQQIQSSELQVRQLAAGQTDNLHHIMTSLEKAKLSFELTLQVRNKLLEGYQEIMRMQI